MTEQKIINRLTSETLHQVDIEGVPQIEQGVTWERYNEPNEKVF